MARFPYFPCRLSRKLLLVVAGGFVFSTLPMRAQPITFDVASVKPHGPGDRTTLMPPSVLPGGRFVSKFSVAILISWAYKLPTNQNDRLNGMPDWTKNIANAYDVEATGVIPAGLSVQARMDRMRLMVQALLADRFKLAIHREPKEMPVYEIVVAKGGPKLQPADIQEKDCPDDTGTTRIATPTTATPLPDGCHAFSGGQGRGLHARAADMSDLASFVENWTGRPLLDKTGIKGLYRIVTQPWRPIDSPTPPPGAKADDGSDMADVPTLFEVFQKLGLELKSQRDMADVYVVDHIERPSEN